MFEVGKSYKIVMISFTHEGPNEIEYTRRKVADVQLPLVKLTDGMVINTSAPTFGYSEPLDD